MKLLLIRHAPALDREIAAQRGLADRLRPLTPSGRRKLNDTAVQMRPLLSALVRKAEEVRLYSSPWLRAQQSAEVWAAELGLAKDEIVLETSFAFGSDPEETTKKWLLPLCLEAKLSRESLVLAVGHEPHLSELLSLWSLGFWSADRGSRSRGAGVGDRAEGLFSLRKSGVACVSVELRNRELRGASPRPSGSAPRLEFQLQWLLRPSALAALTRS